MPPVTPNQKIQFSDFHESYLSRYIALADAKSGVALTINAGVIGFIATRTEWWTVAISGWVPFIALVANGALPLIAGGWCLWTIMPRGSPPTEGFIFWRSIRQHPTEADFVSKFSKLSVSELANERLSHSYALAGVATRKYNSLYNTLLLTGVAALVTVAHLLWDTVSAAVPSVTQPAAHAPLATGPSLTSPSQFPHVGVPTVSTPKAEGEQSTAQPSPRSDLRVRITARHHPQNTVADGVAAP